MSSGATMWNNKNCKRKLYIRYFNLYWPLKLVAVEFSFANCLPLHMWRSDQSVLHDKVVEYFAIRTYYEPVESSLCCTITYTLSILKYLKLLIIYIFLNAHN
jgi:hypothetical protein